ALYEVMWSDVGILRDRAGLARAAAELERLHELLERTGLADRDPVFNPTWHDWLNLDSLLGVSKVIARAALAREDSRGAHHREDFPAVRDLERSAFTRVRMRGRDLALEFVPVEFTRVRPGETLLKDEKAAA
ncbi:MAG TPA: succinate dehydrogenase/fumarate reductase flavoprotein subunit, partial [Burkholderiales bacterium]|nr:succinate dehydrogenase/fumarate reductase flavoprotein subunit [Burkholderiales bacterium]